MNIVRLLEGGWEVAGDLLSRRYGHRSFTVRQHTGGYRDYLTGTCQRCGDWFEIYCLDDISLKSLESLNVQTAEFSIHHVSGKTKVKLYDVLYGLPVDFVDCRFYMELLCGNMKVMG